ncbi:MAG: hypothetical protein ACREM6_07180 [Vulcanimicrobiaceae bacterium]
MNDPIAGSMDLDVMPLDGSDRWVYTLACIEGSMFAESNDGAFADPVSEGVATLASGWRERLIRFETPNMIAPNGLQARAWVLEPHDLLASKYIAGRPNDFRFCEAVIDTGIVSQDTLIDRLVAIQREHPTKELSASVALSVVTATFNRAADVSKPELVRAPAAADAVDSRHVLPPKSPEAVKRTEPEQSGIEQALSQSIAYAKAMGRNVSEAPGDKSLEGRLLHLLPGVETGHHGAGKNCRICSLLEGAQRSPMATPRSQMQRRLRLYGEWDCSQSNRQVSRWRFDREQRRSVAQRW